MATMASDLQTRLQTMLSLQSTPPTDGSKEKSLIEIIDDAGEINNSEVESAHDDDEPPPIFQMANSTNSNDATNSNATNANGTNANVGETSLAEQMLNEANEALRKKKSDENLKQRKTVDKATFGVKKGFLNASSSSKSKKKTGEKSKNSSSNSSTNKRSSSTQSAKPNHNSNESSSKSLIYELDEEGNMIPSQPNRSNSSSSLLQEAQTNLLNHLQSTNLTPTLLQTLSTHPKLSSQLSNPKFKQILERLQSHPRETLEALHTENGEGLEFVQELCGVLGECFERMGVEQEKAKQSDDIVSGGGVTTSATTKSQGKIRELGPLEEKALRAHQTSTSKSNTQPTTTTTSVTDEQVQSILSNNELTSILMDIEIQNIIQECCTQNGKLGYYMQDGRVGPKLKRLMEAGLLGVA